MMRTAGSEWFRGKRVTRGLGRAATGQHGIDTHVRVEGCFGALRRSCNISHAIENKAGMADDDSKRSSPKEDKESKLDVLIVDTDEGGADVVLTGRKPRREGKAKTVRSTVSVSTV